MGRQVTVNQVDSITDSRNICHFDELSDLAKDTLTHLVRDDTAIVIDAEVANELVRYDAIKFTDYLRVSYVGSTASGPVSA